MLKNKSIYKCSMCDNEVKAAPARKIVCSRCKVDMKEIERGIIRK